MIRRCVVAQRMREVFSYNKSIFDTHYNNGIIYIHIPKAAGTSIALAVYDTQIWHYTAAEVRFVNKRKFNDSFKFSFVRNPWGRMYSTYKYAEIDMRKYGSGSPLQFITRYASFEEFILQGLTRDLVKNNYFFWSQCYYLNTDGRLAMDFVGKLENMADDLKQLQELLQYDELKVLKKNQTVKDKTLAEVYSPEMLEKVATVYADDLVAFAYDPEKLDTYR